MQITEISQLKGAGKKTIANLQSLGITQLQDLLFHLPFRYQDKTKFTAISQFIVGQFFVGKGIILKTEIKFGTRRSMIVWVEDDTGIASLRFFYFSMAQQKLFARGANLEFYGEVRYTNNCSEMVHPQMNLASTSGNTILESRLTPVYTLTKGLSQRIMCNLINQVLQNSANLVSILPEYLLQEYGFNSLQECLFTAHQPPVDGIKINQARDYLAFEELVAHHFALKKIKQQNQLQIGIKINASGKLRQQCVDNLPFMLTNAQTRVIKQIIGDLHSQSPMQRLLQGDVGSGKTVVAVMAGLECIEAGLQCALMAPTEILAGQHYQNIKSMLESLSINCQLLTSKLPSADKKIIKAKISDGTANFIIGTHALIQAEVKFNNLGLAIIDEQHRFGVEQRSKLSGTSQKINQLIMTATPIPRTLAMSFYAFLDYSVLDELPTGRIPIATSALSEGRRDAVINKLNQYCGDGKQAYWVCPLIDKSEILQCQTATQTYEYLVTKLPNLAIGLVHSKVADKNQIMLDFKAGKYAVLVATTVIEVGVDVANASLMIIDNSERLGLSQLHQLRGRVGRGTTESNCVLLYKPPLSANGKARIDIMLATNDGFKIAEQDLQIRGAGELLGRQQTGDIKFRLADFAKDKLIIHKIIKISAQLDQVCDSQCQLDLINRWRLDGYVS